MLTISNLEKRYFVQSSPKFYITTEYTAAMYKPHLRFDGQSQCQVLSFSSDEQTANKPVNASLATGPLWTDSSYIVYALLGLSCITHGLGRIDAPL